MYISHRVSTRSPNVSDSNELCSFAAPKTINLDIALVKLVTPVKLDSDYINVACLPREDDVFPPGMMCLTAGWGHTEEGQFDGWE